MMTSDHDNLVKFPCPDFPQTHIQNDWWLLHFQIPPGYMDVAWFTETIRKLLCGKRGVFRYKRHLFSSILILEILETNEMLKATHFERYLPLTLVFPEAKLSNWIEKLVQHALYTNQRKQAVSLTNQECWTRFFLPLAQVRYFCSQCRLLFYGLG